jgi:hypothetical protein
MKKYWNALELFKITLCIAGVLLLSACTSDEKPEGNWNVSAKINGSEWKGSGNSQVVQIGNIVTTSVGAGNVEGSALAIQIQSDQVGTYNIEGRASYTNAQGVVFNATSGALIITRFETNKLAATFNFNATQAVGGTATVEISEGKIQEINVTR